MIIYIEKYPYHCSCRSRNSSTGVDPAESAPDDDDPPDEDEEDSAAVDEDEESALVEPEHA